MEIFLIAFATFFFGFALGLIAMYYGLQWLAKKQMQKAFGQIGGFVDPDSPVDPMKLLSQMLENMSSPRKQ